MMDLRIFLPRDTTSLALGAERVALVLDEEVRQRELNADIVRNGSRGLFWLEPLLEIERGGTRFAFGPMTAAAVPG